MRLEIVYSILLALADVDCENKQLSTSSSSSDYDVSDDKHYWESSDSSDDDDNGDTLDVSLSGKLRRQLALSLFLQNPMDSAVCSPISALMPLGKLVFGAEGPSRKELLTAIGVKKLAEVKGHFKKMIRELRDNSGVRISICSGIYISEGLKLKSQFKQDAESTFGTGVERVDFSNPKAATDRINAWVLQHTNNKIKNILHASDVTPAASMILVNAVYFSAKWANPFQKAKQGTFYGAHGQQNVQLMKSEQYFKYYDSSSLNAEIVAIPYQGNKKISFVIVLPKSRSSSSLSVLLKQLKVTPDLLKSAMNKMKQQSLTLTMPKFKIETKFDLNVQYRNIGLNTMFHKGLKKIVENRELFVSKSVQSAMIEVNEHGTTAAAASTVEIIMTSGRPSTNKHVVADHPFLFTLVVKDQQLFTGILTGSPTARGDVNPLG